MEIKKTLFPKTQNYDKLQVSQEGLYSMTSYTASKYILKIIERHIDPKKSTITDGTGGNGGDAITFAMNFKKTNICEINEEHCKIIKNNLDVYGLKADIINGDYTEIHDKFEQDIIYLDPPWGGKDYMKQDKINIYLSGIEIGEFINKIVKQTKIIAIKIPNNYDISNIKMSKMTIYQLKKFKLIIIFCVDI